MFCIFNRTYKELKFPSGRVGGEKVGSRLAISFSSPIARCRRLRTSVWDAALKRRASRLVLGHANANG